MGEVTYRTVSAEVRAMFGAIAERYDIANTVLSGGTHFLWKWHFARFLPAPRGGKILDLCTGTGDLVPHLSAASGGTVVGADFCAPMLRVAKRRMSSFAFLQGDGLRLPFRDDAFDLVTVSFGVRNFENVGQGLREIARVLSPGGEVRILEFGQPRNRFFRAAYRSYSKYVMPWIGSLLTGNRAAYEYLPETAERFPCREDFARILEDAGFSCERIISYTFGIAYGYVGRLRAPGGDSANPLR